MYAIKHENCVVLHNHFELDNAVYLVLEYCSGG